MVTVKTKYVGRVKDKICRSLEVKNLPENDQRYIKSQLHIRE